MKLEVVDAEHRESIVPAVHFVRSTVINVEEEKACSGDGDGDDDESESESDSDGD